ncbi:MAG: hypothetical protein KGZ34_07160 [Nitrosarchaeum sp.]|nr:hypothetical protein [Nitrosarchaeum sp.]
MISQLLYTKRKDQLLQNICLTITMVLIGGINPNKMFQGLLSTLVQKGILTQSEVDQIVSYSKS